MKNISRPLFYTLLAVLVIGVIAAVLASGHYSLDGWPTLTFMDDDLSDSVFGWAIAIPVMIFVGVILVTVFTGVALVVTVAVACAAVVAVLAVVLAFTPVILFLAIPLLAIFGLVKLFQRDSAKIAAAHASA